MALRVEQVLRHDVPGTEGNSPPERAVTWSTAWQGWQAIAKRWLDIVAALCLLLVLAPVLAIVALLVRLDSRGPIIFRQTRVGRDGRHFQFLKFRSMVADAETRLHEVAQFNEVAGPIFKMKDDPRLTRVGRVLRRTSFDELPQLWNVLKGDMSLVGPRPPLPSEVDKYEPWECNRLLVSAGITGLWQTSGRSNLGFDQMVRLDVQYIEQWSLWLDVRILWATVAAVFRGEGAY